MSNIDNFFDSVENDDSDDVRDEFTRRISWSQFKTYQKCPKKWELKYKEGNYIPSDSIHTIFGTGLHEAIQTYLKTLYNDSVQEAENLDLESILVETMKEEFREAKKLFEESDVKDEEYPANRFEMKKFLMDGKKILNSFKSNRTDYFNTQKTDLVGIEFQVNHSIEKNIDYVGYLDVVLRNKRDNSYKIIDLKTSKEGWDKWKKKDKLRVNQLVSYKAYYADMLDTDPENIEVEYIIFRRKTDGNGYYPKSRIQTFSPSDGSITQNKVQDQIENFVNETYNPDGTRKDKEYEPDPGKFKCCWCPFSKQFEGEYPVCDQGGKEFDNYPSGMKGYVDDKWIDE